MRPSIPSRASTFTAPPIRCSSLACPGYTESKSAGEDCDKCVGKAFVAKGGSAPAGHSAAEVVHEERIGAPVRVIRPSDGIASAESNPNRLTLILNKDGKITTAVWE